jgi:putative Mg2+ transporter-C (MgtC) family protein
MGSSGSAVAAAAAAFAPACWTTASPVSMMGQLRLTVRMVYAALLGAIVGQERCGSKAHRYSSAGGIRTMASVSLGAATFTLCSMYGFSVVGGASRYDHSRMAANVSSGVGFIGAGVIATTTCSNSKDHASSSSCGSMVHGLTTAAAIWLSAGIGVGCSVGMCALSTFTALLTIAVLRRILGSAADRNVHDELRGIYVAENRSYIASWNTSHLSSLFNSLQTPIY